MISQIPEIISPSWDILDKIFQLGGIISGIWNKKSPKLGCFIPIFFLGFLFYRNFIVQDFVNSWVFYSGFCDIIWRDKKWNNSVDFLLIIFFSILNLNFNWLKFMILCKKWRKTIIVIMFKNKSALCSWKKSRVCTVQKLR